MLWLDHTIAMMRVWLLLLNLFILCLPIMSLLRVYTYTLSLRSTRVLLARLHATSKLKSLGSKALVIVESPTKAKTIGAFLQSNEKYQNYIIDSCAGHIREISSELKDNRVVDANLNIKISDLGIDVFKSFKPEYRVMPQKREVIQRLKDHCKGASEILLATDEDREGEAISAHLVDVLKPSIPYKRVVFHEITKSAIEKAFEQPRDIDTNLVSAQEARSILDKLAGYTLSPLIWRFITYGLSAGRVQSCGLKLIAEKEKQRWDFKSSNYHTIDAMLKSSKLTDPLVARLHTVSTLRVATERDFDGLTGAIKLALHDKVAVLDTEQSRGIMEALSANTSWEVTNKQSKVISKSPPLPFITSSLQQDSSRQLGYSPGRTMQLAQGLYERGYITYMRTDSPTLSDNAKVAATKLIVNTYGKEYLASERDKRKSCSSPPKNAQEAHEAIRPAETNGIFRHPDSLKGELAGDEWRLYDLIFRRTVASLMKPSESLSVTLTISAGDIGHIKGMGKAEKGEVDGKEGMGKALFRCSGTAVHTPGYLKVWDREGSRNYRDNELTRLEIGDKLTLARSEEVWKQAAIAAEEEDLGEENEAATAAEDAADDSALKLEFPGLRSVGRATKAPGRYTESSFIHALETIGVGRPSTYSYILSILREREYIIVDKQSLIPTVKGLLVSRFLTEHFQHFISEEFTAQMESNLDAIAKGDVEKTAFLSQFYFGMDVPPPSASDLMKKKGGDSKGLLQTASQLIDLHKMWKDETSQIDRREYKSLAIPQLADLGKVRITRNGLLFAANYSVVPEGDNELERMWKLPIDIELDIRELTREKVLDILKTAPNVQGNLLGMLPETKENVYLKYGRYGKYLELIPEGADTSSRKVVSRTFKLPYAWYNMTALDFHVPMEDIEALVQLPKTLGISDLQGHGMYEAALDMKNNDLVILFKQLDGDESKRQVFMLPFPRPSFLPGNTEDAVLSKFSVEDAAQLLKAHLDNPLGTEVLPAQGKLVSLTDCRELGMWAYDSDKNTDPAAISIRYGRFGYYLHATKANIVAGLGKRPVESVTLEMAIELLEKKKARMSKAKLAAVKTIKKRAPKAKASASQTEKKSTRAASLKTPAKRKVAKKVPEEASGQVEAQPKALRRTKVVSSDAASPVKNKATTKLKKEALVAKKKTNKGARVGGKKKVSGAAKASLVEDDKDTSSIEVKKPRASREKRSKLL